MEASYVKFDLSMQNQQAGKFDERTTCLLLLYCILYITVQSIEQCIDKIRSIIAHLHYTNPQNTH